MDRKWSKEFPNKAGWYWFFGKLWNVGKPDYTPVEILSLKNSRGGKSAVGIAKGTFIYSSENHIGFWISAILPPMPNEDNIE